MHSFRIPIANVAQGIDKAALMNEVSDILHELSGTVYTGCDLNTSIEDMEILVRIKLGLFYDIICLSYHLSHGHAYCTSISWKPYS